MNDDISRLKETFYGNLMYLESIINNMTAYSVIQASGTLRLLLLDYTNGSKPLIMRLMENKNFEIFFEINGNAAKDKRLNDKNEDTYVIWREVNPFNNGDVIKLSMPDFLNHQCLYYRRNEYTIREVIKFYCYCMGGVHLKEVLEGKNKEMYNAFEAVKIEQASQLDYTMKGIIEVVYNCLNKNKEKLLY